MKVFFLGTTSFSDKVLRHLLDNNIDIHTVFTTTQEFKISYSQNKNVKNYNFFDLEKTCKEYSVKCVTLKSSSGEKLQNYKDYFIEHRPDIILVMGWFYMVPSEIRSYAKNGAWGIHASLLPNYAGGAPLVWAIINGEKETGVTLFKLDEGVDDGDIIDQERIEIGDDDTISDVYEKATEASKRILLNALQNPDKIKLRIQDKSLIKVYPQRKPDDGEIDLCWSSGQIYNFVRAQSAPYPGAFIRTSDGKKIIIEKCRISE